MLINFGKKVIWFLFILFALVLLQTKNIVRNVNLMILFELLLISKIFMISFQLELYHKYNNHLLLSINNLLPLNINNLSSHHILALNPISLLHTIFLQILVVIHKVLVMVKVILTILRILNLLVASNNLVLVLNLLL